MLVDRKRRWSRRSQRPDESGETEVVWKESETFFCAGGMVTTGVTADGFAARTRSIEQAMGQGAT